ncbi:RNA 2',3'-cyclic phosphodiesterase [Carboxylicivirga mesophila]|uniref:RNA 2',3'-cyclic phosphodiesterase n=1 Tax=Carboxylicivirga mesophila TaxID=1166478 RepID=A0ABS5K7Q6_9BACT|nr:RNA 2',3'-cyclic phosphodiesterase [Carboxylicivirga mesophila]MBS2210917.1 RNA 2',3'-cyclic phosphodiesterase [Carboxylicivirga mesophila]
MRLFIAIDCNGLQTDLKTLQEPFYEVKARFVKDFHLTLKFIGEVGESDYIWIENQLKGVKVQSFYLQLNQLGTFKSYSQQVVWCGVNESDELNQLHHEVERLLGQRHPSSSSFHPHITLARLKHPHKLSSKTKELIQREMAREAVNAMMQVDKFMLIESKLTPSGPVYIEKASYPLNGIWRDD